MISNAKMTDFVQKFWTRYDWHRRSDLHDQRRGQARMNALRDVAPELYELVTGTPEDVFYVPDVSRNQATYESAVARIQAFDKLIFGTEYFKHYSLR